MERNIYKIGKELVITSDEEIKEGDWCVVTNVATGDIFIKKHKGISTSLSSPRKKIILTTDRLAYACNNDFIDGAKWQAERMYSEEEVLDVLVKCINYIGQDEQSEIWMRLNYKKWFEQFKKK
jgi:hypothetical protein